MGNRQDGTRAHNATRIAGAAFCGILAAVGAIALNGCKAKEAPNTGFTSAEQMKPNPQLPFNRSWRKPGIDWKNYDKLYVAEVNTSYMLKESDWQKGERKDEIQQDVKKLGEYTRQAVIDAFKKDPNHRFEVLSAPTNDPKAIQLELALTEVVPSKVLLNALGYAPFYVGTAVSAARFIASDQSSVAFEGRVRDCATNEVIAMAADRETEQYAPVSVRGLTWYGHSEFIITQWANQFVKTLDRKPGETVKGTDTFTLQPW